MKLEFFNCPKEQELPGVNLPEAEFLTYQPDFELIKALAKKYQDYKNILVIGHGGSITSFYGFYCALKHKATKKAYFLSTVDPDYIYELKHELKPQDTLVLAISKSGETVTQIESLLHFLDYPILIITGKSSPLRAMAEKLQEDIVLHPTIGGRFTGLTEVGLIPAALCGMDAESLFYGGREEHERYKKDNFAWRAASVFYQLEQKGFSSVFMPFYSHGLFGMSNLIVQLCHESFGKNGKGQTYFAHEAPESQHHTNQRFFGGQKNICGFFTSCHSFIQNIITIVPAELHSVQIKNRALFDLNKIPLSAALNFECQATLEDARISGIPTVHLELSAINEKQVGALTAFWQLFAVYSSVLREVNPFDQPQVENSKRISFDKRLKFKDLL